jgi:hypothetical protein
MYVIFWIAKIVFLLLLQNNMPIKFVIYQMKQLFSSKIKRILPFLVIFLISIFILVACKKYKDPTPPKIVFTTDFCNMPTAVNYNWGFPGNVNNNICIYPADAFVGNYRFFDSILDQASGSYLFVDSSNFTINKITDSTLLLLHCGGSKSISAKATRNIRFYTDSTSEKGQVFCTASDTMNGTGRKQNLNDSLVSYTYNVWKGALLEQHKGLLVKK